MSGAFPTTWTPGEGLREPVPVVVVGLGRIGALHARNLAWRVPGGRLVAVADADGARARIVGEELGVHSANGLEEALERAVASAVVIATPVDSHVGLVERACAAGLHVFCEKPLAADDDGTRRAVAATRSAGVQLQVGFQMRFDPSIATLADRVRAGELGSVRLFRATLRDMRPPAHAYLKESGGLVLDGAIHTADLARLIVGEIDAVAAFRATPADPVLAELGDSDTVVVLLRFRNGALGVLEHSRMAGYGFDCRIEVMGSRATARTTPDITDAVETLLDGERRIKQPADFIECFQHAYRLEIESFVHAIARGERVRATGDDAFAALAACRAAATALDTGRRERVKEQITAPVGASR